MLYLLLGGYHLGVWISFWLWEVKFTFLFKLAFVFLGLEDACLYEGTLLLLPFAKPVEATVLPFCFFLLDIKVSRIPDPQILPTLYFLRKGKGFPPPNPRVEVPFIETKRRVALEGLN